MKRIAGVVLLLTISFLATGTEGAVSRTISWRNPTTYENNSEISAVSRATIETRLYYSLDLVSWTRFATVSAGEESWAGVLPVDEGIPGYYAVTTTIPSEGIESRLSGVIVYPPDVGPADPVDEVTVTIGNFQDTFVVWGEGADTNYSTYPLVRTYIWPDNHVANRGFLKWDLSSLPAGIHVANASLRLYYADKEGEGGDDVYSVHVAKVIGANPDLVQATWNSSDSINGWTGGTDGGAKNLAPAESTVAVGKNQEWVVWNITNMVQEWVEAPETNYGMAIDPDPAATVDSNRYFASQEHPDPALRPQLVITYEFSPVPGNEPPQEVSALPVPMPVGDLDGPVDTFTVLIGKYEDTFVNLGIYSDINYSSNPEIRTYTWPKNNVANRGFIRWDLSGVPTDAAVANATLWLYYVDEDNGGVDNTYTVDVSKVSGVRPDPGFATWNQYDGFSPWPGGEDGGASAVGPAISSTSIGKTHRWVSWDITEMVGEWVAEPEKNFGVAIDADPSASRDANRYFASREYPDPGLRPRLLVTYTISRQGAPIEADPFFHLHRQDTPVGPLGYHGDGGGMGGRAGEKFRRGHRRRSFGK